MSIELVSTNHLTLCHLLLLLPSIAPSIRVFSNELTLHIRWPKDWSFSFGISPSSEYSELISFRMDWLDLLAVQGTLKSLLQHHSSKVSALQCSAFFIRVAKIGHDLVTEQRQQRRVLSIVTVSEVSWTRQHVYFAPTAIKVRMQLT